MLTLSQLTLTEAQGLTLVGGASGAVGRGGKGCQSCKTTSLIDLVHIKNTHCTPRHTTTNTRPGKSERRRLGGLAQPRKPQHETAHGDGGEPRTGSHDSKSQTKAWFLPGRDTGTRTARALGPSSNSHTRTTPWGGGVRWLWKNWDFQNQTWNLPLRGETAGPGRRCERSRSGLIPAFFSVSL